MSQENNKLGFWQKLQRPILCLAPMADVTDAAFRQIIAKYGKPDIFFTEFVSVDGLCSLGKEKLIIDLQYGKNEHPIVAQIFGSKPENFERVAKMLVQMGFDGIDINMGCPVKKIINQSSCSALIRTPELAQEIILATKRGAGSIPISVKTRIGFNKIELEAWIPKILETEPAALTVHLRTVKEMSSVPAHWEMMKRIIKIRDEMKVKTLILGNGDVLDLEEAKQKIKETGCDGIMLGRAIFGNPWLFHSTPSNYIPSLKEKLNVMIEHTKLFEKMLGKHKNFALMKKHYKAYVNGFDGAKELRVKLMETENALQVENIVQKFLLGTNFF
ncbi:hypothetical protein A3A05_03315 [Candidatus Nomurabacteria bacterium RIFCSPLOWO2_01_FULL_41_12]|uniref:tRNA-dihydrouridine synthase n=1 Tax=Candidatus Nomurabacteria bacterium RIFCSPLOWO2_01_FULL_41_12 TaxID=1801774 RepID=A0A1F6WV96_9BACT|nr:MAG: hypothetical protein A2732_02365 [Candidatus Nomurabacteria bacterium RIFCSPHIGHO2_01_FULL_40_10]OGI85801.1 MAG: hypothetical protein A3A05_03315 [Candidatus Nomurabacteria bacterium RIFCSPLOWO2_01_FULL_41_12]